MKTALGPIAHLYVRWMRLLKHFQSPLLLAIRLYWGYHFYKAGMGKLENLDHVVEYFASLGIPAPEINAVMAATTETVGGICLLLGLGSRLITVPLIFTMIVAYATAEREALMAIFSDSGKFIAAAPFTYLFASLLILVFGPGCFSIDAIIKKRFGGKCPHTSGGCGAESAKTC